MLKGKNKKHYKDLKKRIAFLEEQQLYEKIKLLKDRQMLIVMPSDQIVIDNVAVDDSPASGKWDCVGKNVKFVKCTKDIVDNSGCAEVVKHGDTYCSRACKQG